jgi:hypothetical protein
MLHFDLSGSVLRKTTKNLLCSYSNALPSIRIDEKIIHLILSLFNFGRFSTKRVLPRDCVFLTDSF